MTTPRPTRNQLCDEPWDKGPDEAWDHVLDQASERPANLPAGRSPTGAGEAQAAHTLLRAAEEQARHARAALANGDRAVASAEGHELLTQVEDLLGELSSREPDRSTWTTALRLRDQLGG